MYLTSPSYQKYQKWRKEVLGASWKKQDWASLSLVGVSGKRRAGQTEEHQSEGEVPAPGRGWCWRSPALQPATPRNRYGANVGPEKLTFTKPRGLCTVIATFAQARSRHMAPKSGASSTTLPCSASGSLYTLRQKLSLNVKLAGEQNIFHFSLTSVLSKCSSSCLMLPDVA